MNENNPVSPHSDPLLTTEEIVLATKKLGMNKVIFGAMLKIFEKDLQFPTNSNRPSDELLLTLYKQLIDFKTPRPILQNYDWNNRSVERFRQEIRKYFGFRLFKNTDKKVLEKWLIKNAFKEGMRLKRSKRKCFDFFKENKIEVLDPNTLDAYVRLSYTKFDKSFLYEVFSNFNDNIKFKLEQLIGQIDDNGTSKEIKEGKIQLVDLKKDPPDIALSSILIEANKLNCLQGLELPKEFLSQCNQKLLRKYYLKIMRSFPSEVKKIPEEIRYAIIAVFCYVAGQNITDNFSEILLQRIHMIESSAEIHVEKKLIKKLIKTEGKMDILLELANIAVSSPTEMIEKAIYPLISQEKLKNIVEELRCKGKWYGYQVKRKMRTLYSHYHRRLLLILLKNLTFKSSNPQYDNLLKAIEFIKQYSGDEEYYDNKAEVPITNVISKDWASVVFEEEVNNAKNENPKKKINRFYYELAVFNKFFENLSCKNIWVEGARKYRDPNEDLPKDWNSNSSHYYKSLNQPEIAGKFTDPIKKLVHESLEALNKNIPLNKRVKIIKKSNDGWIKISPSPAQKAPKNLEILHKEIEKRWQNISLLDILKEADLEIDFTDEMTNDVDKKLMDKNTLRKRILLAIYGIGTNIGLKPVYKGNPDVSYGDLRYVKRSCIDNTAIRNAIAKVINKLLEIRDPAIWGNDTMSCICDSTLIRVMDQNFVAQWHPRYREKGIMIYWHVEKGSACVYSQLKTCLSSEVGSMMQGILSHNTKMSLKNAYMDTHGQSLSGFGFSNLLGVSLLPRLKNIYSQKLYYVNKGDDKKYANLALILADEIDWNLIEEQYDEMIKYAAALKFGFADADVIMKRFSRNNYNHPVYKAICELGKAIKTIFLCRYLSSEELRVEIHESLNIVERVNGFMHFILLGKLGTIFTNKKNEQEKIILCLHLIEVCLVYVNTLMIQEVLSEPGWKNLLMEEDRRAITSLIHGHINPYGLFTLDMDERIPIKAGDKKTRSVDVGNQLKIIKNLLEEVE